MRSLFIIGETREQVVEILERVVLCHADINTFGFVYCYYPQSQFKDISKHYCSLFNCEGFSVSIHERVFLGSPDNDTESLDSILKLVDHTTSAALVVSEKMENSKRQHIYDRYTYRREGIEGFNSTCDLLEDLYRLHKLSKQDQFEVLKRF